MKLLPTENITYKTTLNTDVIIQRLANITEPEKMFRIWSTNLTKTYEGNVSGHKFKIRRIINYRNSFLPRITGTIEKDFNGVTINVKMKLHTLVIVFLCIYCSVVAFGFLVFVLSQISSKSGFNPANLILLGMLLFVYILTMGGFKYESKKAKDDLQKLFEAEIIEF